jgi:hypothetical protein
MVKSRHPWLHLRPWERHSLVLAVAGLVYIGYGILQIILPVTDSRREGLQLLTNIAPLSLWGVVWIFTGCLALLSTRWPPQSKTWGYTALSGVAAGWASGYLFGVIFLDVSVTVLTGAMVWYLVAFLWFAISGLLNPGDAPKVR